MRKMNNWIPLTEDELNRIRSLTLPPVPPDGGYRFSCNEVKDSKGNLITKYCDYDKNGKYTDSMECMKKCGVSTETSTPTETSPSKNPPIENLPYSCVIDKSGNRSCVPDDYGDYPDLDSCKSMCEMGQTPTATSSPIQECKQPIITMEIT